MEEERQNELRDVQSTAAASSAASSPSEDTSSTTNNVVIAGPDTYCLSMLLMIILRPLHHREWFYHENVREASMTRTCEYSK